MGGYLEGGEEGRGIKESGRMGKWGLWWEGAGQHSQPPPRPRCQEHRHLAGTQAGSVEAVLSLPLPRGPRGLASLLGLPSPGDSRQVLPSAPQTPRHSGTALLLLGGDSGPDPPRAAMLHLWDPTHPFTFYATTFQ